MTPMRAALFTQTRKMVANAQKMAAAIMSRDNEAACLALVFETFACDAEAAMRILNEDEPENRI